MPFVFLNETSDVVEVKKSLLPNAGKGLFAKKKIKRGEFIAWYTGVYVDAGSVDNDYYDSDYIWGITNSGLYIDAADPKSCLGRYINDSLSLGLSNCKLKSYENTYSAGIVATKAIPKGAEVYATYGPVYWNEPKRFRKLNKDDKVADAAKIIG